MNAFDPLSPWFTAYGSRLRAPARLFVLPYSGAGTSVYHPWAQALRGGPVECLGVRLPGRESRLREAPIADLGRLVANLATAMEPLLDRPYGLFGHSLGALLAYQLCRELRQRDLPVPEHLWVAGFRSPELPNRFPPLHALNDAELITALRAYGGTPDEVLADRKFMAMLLPVLRADFALHETYLHADEAPLACPVTALAGDRDERVHPDEMTGWRRHTRGGFRLIRLPGGHFFPFAHSDAIVLRLQRTLEAAWLASVPAGFDDFVRRRGGASA